MKGLLIWIFPLQILFKFDTAETTKRHYLRYLCHSFVLSNYATWIARFNVPLSTIIGRIKVPPIINPPSSTKNAMECRSCNLITLVCSFYHSLSNYAWFDFLSLKLTQSRAMVEQEYHVRPSLPSAFLNLYILGDPRADSGGEGNSKWAGKYGTKESKELREEPLGTMYYQTCSKRSPPFWLLIGARKLLCFFAQSEGRTAATFWNWSGKTLFPGALLAVLYFSSCHIFPPV